MAVQQETNPGRAQRAKFTPDGSRNSVPSKGIISRDTVSAQLESTAFGGSQPLDHSFNAAMNSSWQEYRRRAFD